MKEIINGRIISRNEILYGHENHVIWYRLTILLWGHVKSQLYKNNLQSIP